MPQKKNKRKEIQKKKRAAGLAPSEKPRRKYSAPHLRFDDQDMELAVAMFASGLSAVNGKRRRSQGNDEKNCTIISLK